MQAFGFVQLARQSGTLPVEKAEAGVGRQDVLGEKIRMPKPSEMHAGQGDTERTGHVATLRSLQGDTQIASTGALAQQQESAARALAEPWEPGFELALKRWAKGGFIHLLGSDGHGLDRRRPELAAGFARLAKWVGKRHAQQIAGEGGRAVLEGREVSVPAPHPEGRSWFARLFG